MESNSTITLLPRTSSLHFLPFIVLTLYNEENQPRTPSQQKGVQTNNNTTQKNLNPYASYLFIVLTLFTSKRIKCALQASERESNTTITQLRKPSTPSAFYLLPPRLDAAHHKWTLTAVASKEKVWPGLQEPTKWKRTTTKATTRAKPDHVLRFIPLTFTATATGTLIGSTVDSSVLRNFHQPIS